jgi:hypothetical protein
MPAIPGLGSPVASTISSKAERLSDGVVALGMGEVCPLGVTACVLIGVTGVSDPFATPPMLHGAARHPARSWRQAVRL